MQKSQSGFTLVELVVVIVLLGILGVTALGKFQNLSTDAQSSANAGIASELSSASAINFAAWNLSNRPGSSLTPADVAIITAASCTNAAIGGLFTSGQTPSGYRFVAATGASCNSATGTYICNVDHFPGTPTGTVSPATIICTQ